MALYQIRSTFAFAILSSILFFARQRQLTIPARIQFGFAGIFSGLAVLFFDKAKGQLLQGNFSYLLRAEPLYQVIWENNGHKIFQILNITLEKGYKIDGPIIHTSINILQIIPFARTMFGIPTEHYGKKFKMDIFPAREAGIGSNIWGEGYAIGGFIGLMLMVLLFLAVIVLLNGLLDSPNPPLKIFALVVTPYLAFYIHRLPSGGVLSLMSNFFIITILPWVIISLSNFNSSCTVEKS
ncbi:hypothetical protein ACM16X_04265 [Haloarcula japonica]